MNFVVLDLEWNGAYSKRIKRFINEIIEFGAVLVDEDLNVIDTFDVLVRPQVGKKISGKVSTLTSITDGDLEDGLLFMQAVSKFSKWARDAVVMTWGTSDILTLIENCRYFCGNGRIPFLNRYVDLQEYCESMLPVERTGQQMGLSTAAELLHVNEDEFDHHRALGDSLLTLACLKKIYSLQTLKPFIQNACSDEFYDKMEFRTTPICDLRNPLIRPQHLAFYCENCGKRARRVSDWQLHNKSFRAEFHCRHCDTRFCGRVQFKLKYEGLTVKKKISPVVEKKEDNTADSDNITKPGESSSKGTPET
jgi:inhibitor of KinA sporulation pathway (predicted exonuclease)